jgi:hypothetical protein
MFERRRVRAPCAVVRCHAAAQPQPAAAAAGKERGKKEKTAKPSPETIALKQAHRKAKKELRVMWAL